MKDMQFRVLLDLMMVSDPWPLPDNGSHDEFINMLRNEAKQRGYDDEIVAYHNFLGKHALPKKVEKRKPRKARGIKKTK